MKTYVFAGSSSSVAVEAAGQLTTVGHRVIAISTREAVGPYTEHYQVEGYTAGQLPAIAGPIDGLVYFPGTISLKPFRGLTEADFLTDYRMNCLGAVAIIQQYLASLKQAGNASVVMFSSVAAQRGMPYHASIAMAKAAIEGLTRSLAAEFAPAIRVNCIAPSLTDTPLAARLLNTPDKVDAARKRNPMKMVGDPATLANTVTYLLSDASAWTTGQVLAVDGGMAALSL
jgi:3-oxoacyl-[acyl-carrier protein] reductase